MEPRTIKKPSQHNGKIPADDPRVARAIFTLRETAAYLDTPSPPSNGGRARLRTRRH